MEQALERRVQMIPATRKITDPRSSHHGKQRVAAYCRVSTNNKELLQILMELLLNKTGTF